jgi:hypothetical protein
MKILKPNLEWYESVSQRNNLLPRCPFTLAYRCPRYYQSVSLLGNSGISTSIDSEEDGKLLKYWQESDLWPITREQEPIIFGSPGKYIFSNFCPEVSFDIFGWFASSLTPYDDEIDMGHAHEQLGKMKADSNDWRWRWAHIQPMHYSHCPLFSPLSSSPVPPKKEKKGKIGFI